MSTSPPTVRGLADHIRPSPDVNPLLWLSPQAGEARPSGEGAGFPVSAAVAPHVSQSVGVV